MNEWTDKLDWCIVWDLRSFKKPVAVHSGLTTLYPGTNALFSPDDKYVITGAGATTKGGKGRLCILKKEGLEEVKTLGMDATPVKVAWHSKINQVSVLFFFSMHGKKRVIRILIMMNY